MSGFVYFLVNPAIPTLVKVGHTTTSVESRIRDLNSTSIPAPFEVAACFKVLDSATTEKLLHEHLHEYRFKENREFFLGPTAKLLELSIPILLSAVAAGENSASHVVQIAKKADALSDRAIGVLQELAGHKRHSGYSTYELCGEKESDLKVVRELATLKALGFVTEKRASKDRNVSTWKITAEGVKFIFDNELLEDFMFWRPP